LAARRASTVTPYSSAIVLNVSPDRIAYVFGVGVMRSRVGKGELAEAKPLGVGASFGGAAARCQRNRTVRVTVAETKAFRAR
jgi:hypothetical protein